MVSLGFTHFVHPSAVPLNEEAYEGMRVNPTLCVPIMTGTRVSVRGSKSEMKLYAIKPRGVLRNPARSRP
jgi:hypothetical protein